MPQLIAANSQRSSSAEGPLRASNVVLRYMLSLSMEDQQLDADHPRSIRASAETICGDIAYWKCHQQLVPMLVKHVHQDVPIPVKHVHYNTLNCWYLEITAAHILQPGSAHPSCIPAFVETLPPI